MNQRLKAFMGEAPFSFNFIISSNRQGFNLRNEAIAAGWDGVSILAASVTVNSGVVLYGADTAGSFAFTCTGSFPTQSSIRLINNGVIIGCGGKDGGSASNPGTPGRDAMSIGFPITVVNNGWITGGGGGGGRGGAIQPGTVYAGGIGGNGSGLNGVVPGTAGGAGVSGGGYSGGNGGSGGFPGRNGSSGFPATGPGGTFYPPTGGGAPGRAIVGAEFINFEVLGEVRGEIVASVNNFIPTPAATPGFSAAFEGGYYLTTVVERVVASNLHLTNYPGDTSPPLSPGEYVCFRVPEMLSKPRFYSGQVLTFARTDSPSTRPQATVVAATGDVLCIRFSVGSFNAGSFFTMSRYRLIISPKENEAQMSFSSGIPVLPAGSDYISDGASNTDSLTSISGSLAAKYCADLVIGGYDDWYLPARNELEVFMRSKKPVTDSNYVTANRPVSAISYATGGDVADTSTSHGVNNTVGGVEGLAYTTSSPSRTGSTLFQSPSGAQRLEFGTAVYFSSTNFSDTEVWAQRYVTGELGRQVAVSKDSSGYVRAIRRSII